MDNLVRLSDRPKQNGGANQIIDEAKLEQAYVDAFRADVKRYFFWAGAQFGTEVAASIYSESFKAKGIDTDGSPIN